MNDNTDNQRLLPKVFSDALDLQEQLTLIRLSLRQDERKAVMNMGRIAVAAPHDPDLTHALHDLIDFFFDEPPHREPYRNEEDRDDGEIPF